nr:RNA-directed DNA polymerase, eukaryota, reverse transcriptase zinc-binding domain protein [Tanacetum cinerariifolium]
EHDNPYELWTKRNLNLNYLRVWGCRTVVRLPDPKLKTFDESGIECIFVGYDEHSMAFSTIRLLIALTSIHNLIIHQMDAKTAFLNGELDTEIYNLRDSLCLAMKTSDEHLEEMHMTWTQFGMKRDEDATLQDFGEAWIYNAWRRRNKIKEGNYGVVHDQRTIIPSEYCLYYTTTVRRTIDQSSGGKLRDKNAEESRELIKDLVLYDNKSWNDPRDFAKLVKAISLPHDVPNAFDRHLIELENHVQCLMEAHLAPKLSIQVNKITFSCEICGGPHDTQYCMENLKQAFVDYASSRIDEAGGKWLTFKPEQNNIDDTYNSSWRSHSNLRMVTESFEQAVLAKESSQPQSSYEAAATLTEFDLKKILIDKMDKSKSYLVAPEHRECYEGLKKSYDLDKTFFSTYGKVYSLKRSRKDKDKDEDPSTGSNRRLKKMKTSKGEKPAKGPKAKESQSNSSKGDKYKSKSSRKFVQSEEPEFEVADSDMPHNQEENPGNDDEPKEKVASKQGGDYPFNLTKPLPLVKIGNRQKVPVDYFFNNDLKYLQGRISTMTNTTSLTKTKATKYDLPSIEDMVPNIWSPVKVVYDIHALWGISHWKNKHGYGYLQEIIVRRFDKELYIFKEGDFPRLRINDIKDMILLVVQNRLKTLSGNDVSDFAIALRMFTRSLVIQKRKELQQYRKDIDDKPWVLMGDWNVSLHLEDHSEGGLCKTKDMIEFQECLEDIEVEDLNSSGVHFTWVQSRHNPMQEEWNIQVEGCRMKVDVQSMDLDNLNCRTMEDDDAENMIKNVNDLEVKEALFDICDNKAPGLDGYSTKFYKSGQWLGRKFVSKILTNKIKNDLSNVVNPSQSAFIPGRQITDNILLTQELLRGYNWKNGAKSVALKIDIQKAYDIIRADGKFRYHWGCNELKISHLCFADDLLVLCHGDLSSVKVDNVVTSQLIKHGKIGGIVGLLWTGVTLSGSQTTLPNTPL